jgi:hypothetical protein
MEPMLSKKNGEYGFSRGIVNDIFGKNEEKGWE